MKKKKNRVAQQKENLSSDEMRLNKYIAHCGITSRRKADELIAKGLIKVNGKIVTEVGVKVSGKDLVEYEGKPIQIERKVYVLLNKPKGFLTTTDDDKERKTVMDLVKGVSRKLSSPVRLYPVGRLDRNTTGVLLMTNDGDLSKKLTHPSYEIPKVYKVFLDQTLKKEHFKAIMEGTKLEDGIINVDEMAYIDSSSGKELGLEIHSGKNRIIRRLFEFYGYEVVKLDRMSFGGLTKKDLPRGKWRFLTNEEIIYLKHFRYQGKK